MPKERLLRRFFWRRICCVGMGCAFLLAAATAATPVLATGSGSTAPLADATGITLFVDSAASALDAWSTVPITINLVAERPGTMYYRWGPGPGPWTPVEGAIIAPEGKERLSYVLVAESGDAGPVKSLVLRSDFQAHNDRSASLTGIATTISPSLYDGSGVSVRATVVDSNGVDMRRLGGRSRYDTSVTISNATFTTAQTVLIASGENFPDALTASGLAGCLRAPVLLTQRTNLPASVAAEIKRLGAGTAIICGGPNAVDPVVEAQLKALGMRVERIGGRNRYAVAAAVAQRIEQLAGPRQRAFIARGDLYPDSLALAPSSYHGRTPILLVLPTAMPAETAAELDRAGYDSAIIAGGNNSVGPGVASMVSSRVGGALSRWAGQSRYETAVTIASNSGALGNSWTYVGIATGSGFADALGGGVAAGERNGVILLTQPQTLSDPTRNALTARIGDVEYIDVYGGTVAVSVATYEAIRAIGR